MLQTRIEARRKFLSLSVKALLASSALTFSAALITTIISQRRDGPGRRRGTAAPAMAIWEPAAAGRTVRRVLEGMVPTMLKTVVAAAVPV